MVRKEARRIQLKWIKTNGSGVLLPRRRCFEEAPFLLLPLCMQDTGSLSAVNENALETCEYGLAGVSLTSAAEYPHLASLEAQGRQQSPPPPTLQCPSLASFTTGNTAATAYKPIDTSQGCRSATVHAVSHAEKLAAVPAAHESAASYNRPQCPALPAALCWVLVHTRVFSRMVDEVFTNFHKWRFCVAISEIAVRRPQIRTRFKI